MPTIAGLRRRGYTPEAIRKFCERIGVSKIDGVIDMSWLEDAVREDLNKRAPRVMAVLDPLKVVLTNYPEGPEEELDAVNNPGGPRRRDAQGALRAGAVHRARRLPRGPAEEFFRLAPGREVRLRWALLHQVRRGRQRSRDGRGDRAALHLRPGDARRQRARRPQGESHDPLGLGASTRSPAEMRLYDHLFAEARPGRRRRRRQTISTTSTPIR